MPDRTPRVAKRLPTMRDIAEHLGVSRQLVSLVLRDVPGPSAESRERILAAAEELGYRPNSSARLLRQSRTHLIGAQFQMLHPFQVRFIEKLFTRVAQDGFALVLGPGTPERNTDVVIAELMEDRVEALITFARVRPDGTEISQLTFDERVNWFPHIAPTGDVVVYLSYPTGTTGHPADLPVELRLVSVDDWQQPTTLVALDGGQGTINVPSWAPDGSAFAFVDYPISA